MICKNCGADFDDNLPKCPYCGAFSYAGAEKEYMERLDDLKEDLEELQETVPELYTEELKKQAQHVKRTLLIVCAVVAVLALGIFGLTRLSDSFYEYDSKAALLFAKEAYPVADEYYAAGDYEGLLEFYQTSIEENENADFYNWEHYPFLMCYENYTFFMEAASLIDTKDFSEFNMTELFFCYVSNRDYLKGYPMDEADQQLVSSYEDEMEAVIDSIGLNEKEKKELNDLFNSSDYVSWDEIENFSKKIYQRIY